MQNCVSSRQKAHLWKLPSVVLHFAHKSGCKLCKLSNNKGISLNKSEIGFISLLFFFNKASTILIYSKSCTSRCNSSAFSLFAT